MSSLPVPGDQIGNYRVIEEIGRGGMALVLAVEHVGSGERRALKLMLPAVSADCVQRFHREFRTLSRLSHPGILRVFEHGLYDDRPYLVMELLSGTELAAVVEGWRGIAPMERFRRARKILIALARALEYIHERGLVHRDVTPSNIMVLHDGSVKLMDFGIVKLPGGELTQAGEVVGTVAYIAPEQALDGPVDNRADLYSLGVVFYLMLTGRRPFNARNAAGYLDKHLHRSARPPRELVPTIPELADEVCMRLMAKSPSDRFASATHLLHVLHATPVQVGSPVGAEWVPELVGRGAELGQLRAAVARLVSEGERRGGLLLLEGADGMGRNRIAAEGAMLARREGIALTRSRAQDPDQRAFEMYRPLVEELVRASGMAWPPALAATFGGAGDERVERYAVMKAVAELLGKALPRVIVLYEVGRADRPSLELTEYLVRNVIGVEKKPLLIILLRQQLADDAPDPLDELLSGRRTGVPAERLRLERLSAAAVEELVLTVVADSAAARALAARLHREGDGNPFYIREMLRGLFEDGRLRAGKDGGRGAVNMDPAQVEVEPLPVPGSLRQVIRQRMQDVSADALEVARVAAAAHSELDTELLAQVLGMDEDRMLRALDEGVRARLLSTRRIDGEERVSLHRNRVKDVVSDDTAPERRQQIHRLLGDALELRHRKSPGAVVEALAWHFEQGEVPSKAYPYLLAAAHKLAQRSFLREAMATLERARVMEPKARCFIPIQDADQRLVELLLARARAAKALGQLALAEQEASAADALATMLGDKRLAAATATLRGILHRTRNELDEASQRLRRALELAQSIGDKRAQIEALYEYGAVCWSRDDLEGARGYFEECHASSEAYQDDNSLALGTNGLGLIALCRGQATEARRYFEQSVEVCERAGLIDRLAVARTNLVEVHHLTGNLRKGLDLADRTVAHAREVDHQAGISSGLRARALVLADLGRWPEAVDSAREALRVAAQLGNEDDELSVLVMLLRAEIGGGRLQLGDPELDRALELATRADSEGWSPILHAWEARLAAAAGERRHAEQAIVAAQRAPGRRWPHQQVRLMVNLARAHEALGHLDQCLAQANAAQRLADAHGYRYYSLRAHQLLARCEPDEATQHRHGKVADALARSLAANLQREDTEVFLEAQGLRGRSRRRGVGDETTVG
ncbi:MAG: hypothetical protein RL071_3473 [Pseudomonadota bacterium]